MQLRVTERDRKAQSRAAEGSLAGRIGAPEPIEHACGILGGDAHSEVSHPNGDGLLITVHGDHDGLTLPVFDRVADQIPQDPAHAPGVHVHGRVTAGGDQA